MPRVKTNTPRTSHSKKNTTSKTTIKKESSVKKKISRTKPKTKKIKVEIIKDDDHEFFNEEIKEENSFPDLPLDNSVDESEEGGDTDFNVDNLDQQKKFFSEFRSQDKKEENKPTKTNKSLGLYRRLVIRFVILIVILGAIVSYFSFSKLTIYITPKGEIINDSILVKVYDDSKQAKLNSNHVDGVVKEINSNVSKEYKSSGEKFIGDEIKGRVTIINNYNRNQPLVATTRLLTPDNKLFRIKKAVNVPAKGSVKVDIYTNKPSSDMAVGLTTFTIPGLWVGLQDKIYAKNETPFTFTQKIKKYVRASDISRASRDINKLLIKKAKSNRSLFEEKNTLYDIVGSVESNVNAKIDDEKESFTAQASGKIVSVSFSKEEIIKKVKAKLKLLIPDDKELIDFNDKDIIYSLDSYNTEKKMATIKVSYSAIVALKADTDTIVKKQLVNLNEKQLKIYLDTFPEIKEYKLNFFPSFIHKAPSLPERISIKIKNLK